MIKLFPINICFSFIAITNKGKMIKVLLRVKL